MKMPDWLFAQARRNAAINAAYNETERETRIQERADALARQWVDEGTVVVIRPKPIWQNEDGDDYRPYWWHQERRSSK